MNLKEIQDGAPDGATHYIMNKDFASYFKAEDMILYEWLNKSWDTVSLEFINVALEMVKPLYPNKESKDPTNPSHYKQGKVECIDAIESATVGKKGIEAVLVGNIIKYLWRYEEKNGVEDVEKAKWYLDKLLEKLK